MIARALVSSAVLVAVFTSSSSAQYRGSVGVGVGVGTPWNYYGLPYGPYAFGYPGAVGSFWTNGHSLYGPPVPTYGPTPGAFGGGDAHRGHQNYGWLGYYTPSPRLGYSTVNVYPNDQPRLELTGPSVDAIAPREVPRPEPTTGPSKFRLFRRR